MRLTRVHQLRRYAATIISFLSVLTFSARLTHAQCPAVGNDTVCGAVIIITDNGASVSNTGQGTYATPNENNDFLPTGTLVGVINNSSQPVFALELSGPSIFSFAYDGIDVYGAAGNSQDNTGYGGPNAYFTNITQYQSDGIVNFITAIPPGGGTSYFSLAAPVASGTACANLLTGALSVPFAAGTQISASFTPNSGYSLANAASVCGFTNFDWQQLITVLPSPSPFNDASGNNLTAPVPFSDPPPNGYSYQSPPNAVQLPVYYNLFTSSSDPLSLAYNEVGNTLYFFDAPADPCLSGGNYGYCGGEAPAGSYLAFSTHLVGIVGNPPNATVQDTGIGFSWTDNFNGTVGGIAVLNGTRPVDPGSGTGGITLTAVNNIPTYQYPKGLVIKKVNGLPTSPSAPPALLTRSQISSFVSPEIYIPKTKTFDGIVAIRNVGATTIKGPFQLVLYSLTNGVKLANATGVFGTAPYYTIRGISKLEPGQLAFVIVQFSDPSSAKIKFSPAVYTGGFN